MENSRRIITITHEFHPQRGGIATYVQECARAAHTLGLDVAVWAPRSPVLDSELFPYPIRQLPLTGTQNWSCRLRLARFLQSHRTEWHGAILHLPEPGPIRTWLYFQYAAWARPHALVLTLHGSEIERFSALPHRRHLFRQLLRRADRIGIVSNYSRDLLLQRYPEIEDKAVLTPGALREDLLPAMEYIPRKPRPDGRVVVLTVGRIHPRKGQLAVLEAIALLAPELRRRVIYRVIGPVNKTRYLQTLRQFATLHGIALQYDGVLSERDLDQAYAEADLFALASSPHPRSVEGFGLVYLEASAHGLPILAHRVGGVPDAVRHGETGLKAPPDDRPALAAALHELLENPALRERLGRNGIAWVGRFHWHDTAQALFAPWLP